MVAIVTGISGGLGRAIAEGLAADGHRILGTVYQNDLEQGAVSPVLWRRLIEIIRCDIQEREEVEHVINFAVDSTDKIDSDGIKVLVNNAAIHIPGNTGYISQGEWQQTMDINVTGAFLMTQAVLKVMRERRYGRIINIGSFGGRTGPPGAVAYNTSKAALVGLTKSVASENARHGITCNMINPGCIDTGIFARFPDEVKARLLEGVPMGRAATVDEIVAPVRWLASPEASYITGQVWNIDGGMA